VLGAVLQRRVSALCGRAEKICEQPWIDFLITSERHFFYDARLENSNTGIKTKMPTRVGIANTTRSVARRRCAVCCAVR
jgi:hypothetical protein